jgi:hypothetical protein
MVDFRAYYCAALAQRSNADPYYLAPMSACERKTPAPFYNSQSKATVPAPYPPYALALIAPVTFLPFPIAVAMWSALLILAIVISVVMLSRLTALPWMISAACLSLSLGLTSLPAGNAMPLAVAAITIAAVSIRFERYNLASIALALGMIEPNIVLPAAIGAFVVLKEMRLPLVLVAFVVAAISLAFGGLQHNAEYITAVLPAHALSEVSRDNQYSLSTIVAALGFSDRVAVTAGTVAYAVMTILGITLAAALSRRSHNRSFAIVLPTAFALLGGSFVHTEAIAAAIPATLLLFYSAGLNRVTLLVALLLLSVPWMFATSAALFLSPLVPVMFLVNRLWNGGRTITILAGLSAAVTIGTLFCISTLPAHHISTSHIGAYIDPRLAESAWRSFVLSNSTNRLVTWLLRIPTWAGLILLLFSAAARARVRRSAILGNNAFQS